LSLSGSKEELTALYGELRKPRSELQRAGVSILLEQHGTEMEDAFNKVGEAFNRFEAEHYVVQQNLRDDWLGQLTEVKAQRAALLQAAQDLRRAMLRTLAVLEQPIPDIALPPMVASLETDLNNRQRAYLQAMLYRGCSCPNLTGCGRKERNLTGKRTSLVNRRGPGCPRTACNIPPTRAAAQARPPEAPV
jgi:hypothetical protein